MKQNERFLVYAVTGFLALILAVAVLFGREPGRETGVGSGNPGASPLGEAPKDGSRPSGLQDILGATLDGKELANANAPQANQTSTGLPTPGQVVPGQPLNAGGTPLLAADLLAQQLGTSRRDRMVRFVRAKSGDSLDILVRRWCGARDPYLAEAKCLNEDLVVLRVGQEVAVPWVDDEVLLAGIEAQKPKLLGAEAVPASAGGTEPTPANANARLGFVEPGVRSNESSGLAANAGASSEYLVKQGDSLWRISERTYGKKNADRMIGEIKKANPGLDNRLVPGQKIAMPAAPSDG